MKTVKKIFFRTLIIVLLLALAIGAFFTFVPYSEGMRAGNVIKLSHKGVIFKTHEGELQLSMMPNTNTMGGSTPNVWNFSVANKDVADQLMKASASGERLELFYKERYFKFPWQGDTKYFVYKVGNATPLANPVATPQGQQ
jgi:hypothetical protein